MTDENERGPVEGGGAPGEQGPEQPRQEGAGSAPQGGYQQWPRGGRRRGRRGRGGRGPGLPPRPGFPEADEGAGQASELAAYERRQQQRGGGWRGGAAPFRPQGPRPQFGQRPGGYGQRPGGFGQRLGGMRAGAQRTGRYQDMVRRATAGPSTGPVEDPGEPIAGPHAVLEALRAGRVLRRIYVSQDRGTRTGAVNDLIREAQEKRVLIRFVEAIEVQRLSPGVEHQGVVAIGEGRPGVELDELLLHLETQTEPPLVLVIDSLQDPQNFGVLLRSAEGAGVDGVVIPRHRQVGLTPAVARTSAGASEHLLIADVANLRQAIDALKERGVWVIGTAEDGDVEWDAVDYRGATAIVIGGEGEGIRRLVLEGCDEVVRIPMQGKVASLNAAAAGTVLLFEALRQRMRDAAPAQAEPGPRLAPAETDEGEDLLADEISEDEGAEEIQQQRGAEEMATAEEAEPADDLRADEDTPTGEDVRGDDQDVEEFAEAGESPEAAVSDAPKRATKRTTKATKKTTAKSPTRKRATG